MLIIDLIFAEYGNIQNHADTNVNIKVIKVYGLKILQKMIMMIHVMQMKSHLKNISQITISNLSKSLSYQTRTHYQYIPIRVPSCTCDVNDITANSKD